MNKSSKENAIKALKEFRGALYDTLTEEEKKRVDKEEIEYGAEQVAEMFSEMQPISLCIIMKSVFEKDPRVIVEISKFGDFLDNAFDIFGAEKTASILAKAAKKSEHLIKNLKVEEND